MNKALLLIALALLPGAPALSASPDPAAPPAPLTAAELKQVVKDEAGHIGDSLDTTPPLATGLSPALKPGDVLKAMRKVADWQVARAQPFFNQQWTYGALYTGLLAASEATGDPKYRDDLVAVGEKYAWHVHDTGQYPSADDQCLGQTYLALYAQTRDPQRLAPTRAVLDRLLLAPDSQGGNPTTKPFPWWWCDALYMAPAVWVRAAKATGDAKYLDYMDREWWNTSQLLYDPQDHLYHRDVTFIGKTEANGKPVYWSRGNGWVLAGLARVIPDLPAGYSDRPKFVAQFREMAAKVVTLQGPDGLWRAGLLDPDAYGQPEVSGSAFFAYALAWGINSGLLDRKAYRPVVARAWAGLLQHVYADGRLGDIQPTGAAPAHFAPTATAVYGVGAFLLAGAEVHRLSQSKP